MAQQAGKCDVQGELLAAPGGPIEEVPDAKWPKALVEFIEVVEASHLAAGLSEDDAFRLARRAVIALAEYRGGRVFYLPTGHALQVALQHAEIYRRFNGRNIDMLVSEFGLNITHIYRIIRQQRALHVRRTQRELPLGGQDNGLEGL
ncbi:MAG: Mor transcription activator family protein [Pseudomonadota bacterium]|nr:Mor transcription activator family protein [Pseudomonadota bacterium]